MKYSVEIIKAVQGTNRKQLDIEGCYDILVEEDWTDDGGKTIRKRQVTCLVATKMTMPNTEANQRRFHVGATFTLIVD